MLYKMRLLLWDLLLSVWIEIGWTLGLASFRDGAYEKIEREQNDWKEKTTGWCVSNKQSSGERQGVGHQFWVAAIEKLERFRKKRKNLVIFYGLARFAVGGQTALIEQEET